MMSAQLHAQIDEHAVTSTNLTPVYGTETSTPKYLISSIFPRRSLLFSCCWYSFES